MKNEPESFAVKGTNMHDEKVTKKKGHRFCGACQFELIGSHNWIGQENGRRKITEIKPIFYKSDHYPSEVHFYASLLDDREAVISTSHSHFEDKLSWMHISGDLKK
ncbi:hypothetical protein [uncultured Cohaesibacter sp.]|uniref:hypothetical protein n=1 Tax=uncultured Cohaesibacter sp. TaxID=1002546 RepID=UPI00292F69EC|nr:hypothetical protein [uncultured Cohaesibacter sp.]